jgi:hypothetical protein
MLPTLLGYGYNARDVWIETHVFPILRCAGFSIVHGKDMHGLDLKDEVKRRLDLSDAAIGFFTIRDGQGDADYTSHIWVRDEMIYAHAKGKPIVPVREPGVKVPSGLLGNPQYIRLDQDDRLACVAELMTVLGRRNIRRIRLETLCRPAPAGGQRPIMADYVSLPRPTAGATATGGR